MLTVSRDRWLSTYLTVSNLLIFFQHLINETLISHLTVETSRCLAQPFPISTERSVSPSSSFASSLCKCAPTPFDLDNLKPVHSYLHPFLAIPRFKRLAHKGHSKLSLIFYLFFT